MIVKFKEYKMVIWDFDGVIKESIDIKSKAFEKLFKPFGEKVSKRVKTHHEKNGGLSRFEKIPIYLSWTDKKITKEIIEKLCKQFGDLVFDGVINSKESIERLRAFVSSVSD